MDSFLTHVDRLIRNRQGMELSHILRQELLHTTSSTLCRDFISNSISASGTPDSDDVAEQVASMQEGMAGTLTRLATRCMSHESQALGWHTVMVRLVMASLLSTAAATTATSHTTAGASAASAAYRHYEQAARHFSKHMFTPSPDTTWLSPVAKIVTQRMYYLAIRVPHADGGAAGAEADEGGETPLQETVNMLRTYFNTCLSERPPSSMYPAQAEHGTTTVNFGKRQLLLHLMTLIFRVYFRLNTLHLCNTLIKTTRLKQFPPIDSFPMAQRVTYRYYTGRLALFDGRFEQARDDLQWCFLQCTTTTSTSPSTGAPIDAALARNRIAIFQYLVCVNVVLGRYPKQSTLQRFARVQSSTRTSGTTTGVTMTNQQQQQQQQQIEVVSRLCTAVRRGDLATFDHLMTQHREHLIQRGIYLMWERARIVTLRNLMRTVVIHMLPPGTKRIDLSTFLIALKFATKQNNADQQQYTEKRDQELADEVEGMLCTMIYRGFLRGYLAHPQQKLVVPPRDAFPRITGKHHEPAVMMMGGNK